MSKNKKINIINKHVLNNKKEYILVTLIFIIGIFLGVMFINNSKEEQRAEITAYLNNYVETIKNTEKLETTKMLKTSFLHNIGIGIALWFFGTTLIGIPIVFGIILYKGFCLGYTISATIITLGIGKGMTFILTVLLLQNIIFVPCIIAIAVSGIKLYKSIVRDKNRENIKMEVIRHTLFSSIMVIILLVASVVEILISTNIFKKIIKYF